MQSDKVRGPASVPKHALVTGASSGICAAIVARLLHDGWQVTGISRGTSSVEHALYAHLSIDLEAEVDLSQIAAKLDISALVHAAGLMMTAPLGKLDPNDGARMWRLNVVAAERLANLVKTRLPSGGRIVLIGSRTSSGAVGRSQYAATKAALVAMARSWAAELAASGVTVNVVAPAATATPMLTEPARGSVAPKLPPIGRYIQPAEVAATVAFLLSPDAAAITGQQIVICGGSSL